MSPLAPPAPFPPDPACLQQARADWAEQEAKERKNKDSQPCRTRKPWFTPHSCTVCTALAFCGYATNKVDRDASMLSCSSRNAQAHNMHTHVHTHIHTQTHTCAGTHTHKGTHTQAHRRTDTHAQARTHIHSLAPLHKHTHTL